MNDQGRSVTIRALMRALSGSACGCPCCEAPRNRRCAVCACHPRRHWCSHAGLSPTCIIFHFMSRFSLLYNSFNSLCSRSHFSHMFSLCSHGILGVVFTKAVWKRGRLVPPIPGQYQRRGRPRRNHPHQTQTWSARASKSG